MDKDREKIRNKYTDLKKQFVKDGSSRRLSEEFSELQGSCNHENGDFNYEIGVWHCPDCGFKKQNVDLK